MVYLPNEILNIIFSYRENHPTVKCIKPLIEIFNRGHIDNVSGFSNFNLKIFSFNEYYFETVKIIKNKFENKISIYYDFCVLANFELYKKTWCIANVNGNYTIPPPIDDYKTWYILDTNQIYGQFDFQKYFNKT